MIPAIFARALGFMGYCHVTWGAFHLVKISGIAGSAVNGTRFVRSSHWKIPRKSGKSKKMGPFSRTEFRVYTFLVFAFRFSHLHVSRSLYQFQAATVGHCDVPGFTTKWNNFLPIGNSTFAPIEISAFFPKWKAPSVFQK